MDLGPFAGLIYTVILILNCLIFLILEWTMPRENLDYVRMHWDQERFIEVCGIPDLDSRKRIFNASPSVQLAEKEKKSAQQ